MCMIMGPDTNTFLRLPVPSTSTVSGISLQWNSKKWIDEFKILFLFTEVEFKSER